MVSLEDFMHGKIPLLGGDDFVEFDEYTIRVAARRCGINIEKSRHYSKDNVVGIHTLAVFITQALDSGLCGEANYAYTALCANGERETINVMKPERLIEVLKKQQDANERLTGHRQQRFRSDDAHLDEIYKKLYNDSLWSWAYIYEWLAWGVTLFYGTAMFFVA